MKPNSFYGQHAYYLFVTIIAGSITYLLNSIIDIPGYAGLFVRLLICLIVPNGLYLIFYFRLTLFKGAKDMMKRVIKL